MTAMVSLAVSPLSLVALKVIAAVPFQLSIVLMVARLFSLSITTWRVESAIALRAVVSSLR